ncbi:hypothetical protein J6590_105403, partial [Homalodisca vitripennis]
KSKLTQSLRVTIVVMQYWCVMRMTTIADICSLGRYFLIVSLAVAVDCCAVC